MGCGEVYVTESRVRATGTERGRWDGACLRKDGGSLSVSRTLSFYTKFSIPTAQGAIAVSSWSWLFFSDYKINTYLLEKVGKLKMDVQKEKKSSSTPTEKDWCASSCF